MPAWSGSPTCSWPLLPKRLGWVEQALAAGELRGTDPNAYATELHHAKAIGAWLHDGQPHEADWRAAQKHEEARWSFPGRPWPQAEIVQWLGDYMAFGYLGNDAALIDHAIATWERLTQRSGVKSLAKSPSPRQMGYAYCLHRAGRLELGVDALYEGGRRMLQGNLQEHWLGAGQYIRAATWLKIVHGQHDPLLGPVEVILKAYEDKPKVAKPEYLA